MPAAPERTVWGCLVCGTVISTGVLCHDCVEDGAMKDTGAKARYVKITDAGPEDVTNEVLRHEELFDLQHRRMGEATTVWREAHPGTDLVSPDLGALLTWLIEERQRFRAIAAFLWQRLDNIAAADTVAEDDADFRRLARGQYERRHAVAATDGLALTFLYPPGYESVPDDPAPKE